MPCTPTSWAHQQVSQRGRQSVFTDTSPPGLPAPISGSPPTSGSQGEDWEARPRNAAPHEGPRLRSDPVLSHPAAWEGGWRAVVTMLVLLPPPHPSGLEETSSPLLNGREPGGQTEDLPLRPGHACPSICSAVTCCSGGLFWALCAHPVHRFWSTAPFYFYLRKARVKVAQSWPTLYDPLHYTCVSLHFLEFSRSGY